MNYLDFFSENYNKTSDFNLPSAVKNFSEKLTNGFNTFVNKPVISQPNIVSSQPKKPLVELPSTKLLTDKLIRARKAVDYALSKANKKSTHLCAKYVRLALQSLGFDTGFGVDGWNYDRVAQKLGFKQVTDGSILKGDIIVTKKHDGRGHVALATKDGADIYNDKTASVSDFVSSGVPYKKSQVRDVLIWRALEGLKFNPVYIKSTSQDLLAPFKNTLEELPKFSSQYLDFNNYNSTPIVPYISRPAKTTNRKEALKNLVLEAEGGWSNDKDDSGGMTNKGVTLATFKSIFGKDKTPEDLKNITLDLWNTVFDKVAWDAIRGDEINDLNIASILADVAWGSGTNGIKRMLKALKINPDGVVGLSTLNVLNSGDPLKIFNTLYNARKQYYYDIVAASPKKKKFLKGWLNRLSKFKYEK